MRVLHLYAGNLFGGIEGVLLTLARQRDLCPEMEPHFALCFDGRLSEELRASGVPVEMLGAVRISRPWTILKARRALRRILASGKYDAVIAHSSWVYCLFGPVVRAHSVLLAFWVHDIYRRQGILNKWATWIRPEVLLCNSEVTAQSVAPAFEGISPLVIYHPVTAAAIDKVQARREIRQELRTAANAVVIVQACRLERWKGHELLLEALAQIKDVPDWICWIAGGAQRPHERVYLEELKHRCDRLGLAKKVQWLGQRRDVPAILAAADIHCQPNTGPEPFGIVFVEALHAGLPVITTSQGGPCEILAPGCGELVPPGNADLLAAALRKFIISQDLRGEATREGPRRAAELCDPGRQIGRLRDALRLNVESGRTVIVGSR